MFENKPNVELELFYIFILNINIYIKYMLCTMVYITGHKNKNGHKSASFG